MLCCRVETGDLGLSRSGPLGRDSHDLLQESDGAATRLSRSLDFGDSYVDFVLEGPLWAGCQLSTAEHLRKGGRTLDQKQGIKTASIAGFVDVQVIDDGGPKVLVRLGQINNGEPVDVAVVVMAPELANILSAKLADATFEANWGPVLRIFRSDASIDQGRPTRQADADAGRDQ